MSDRPVMPNENTGAFSRALAGESIPDGLASYLYDKEGKFSDDLHELLVQYAQTVAYKVYHNLRCGHEMDMRFDPLTYVDCGGNKAISHDLFVRLIKYIRKPSGITQDHLDLLKKMFLEFEISMLDWNKIQELRKYEIIGALTLRWTNMMQEAATLREVNDAVKRKEVSGALGSIMDDFAMKRYFESSKIVCDESNNPPSWIDANEPCKVTVYIQWSKSSNDMTIIELPNRR